MNGTYSFDNLRRVEEIIRDLEKLRRDILNSSSTLKSVEIQSEIYQYVKDSSNFFYTPEEGINDDIMLVQAKIDQCKKAMPREYILDFKPHRFEEFQPFIFDNPESKLQYIVHKIRRGLYKGLYGDNDKSRPFESYNLVNLCFYASMKVMDLCSELDISCKHCVIEPGFIMSSNLYGMGGNHSFVIVTINGREFIIDCTYSQFFWLANNNIDSLGVLEQYDSNVGLFMLKDTRRKNVAKKILEDGWIELTPGVLKDYLDGFAISFRNGLYYEDTLDFSFRTKYADHDYRRFLDFEDTQIDHEKREHLGYQLKPLKDSHFNFRR